MPNTVICGIDRSTHARAAARFAGALARRLGLQLQLIHVVEADRPSASRTGMELLRSVVRDDVNLSDVAIRLDSGAAADGWPQQRTSRRCWSLGQAEKAHYARRS